MPGGREQLSLILQKRTNLRPIPAQWRLLSSPARAERSLAAGWGQTDAVGAGRAHGAGAGSVPGDVQRADGACPIQAATALREWGLPVGFGYPGLEDSLATTTEKERKRLNIST